jgi:hypothetical protein
MYAKWTSWWKSRLYRPRYACRVDKGENLEALTLQKKMLFVAWYNAGVSLIYTSLTQTWMVVSIC